MASIRFYLDSRKCGPDKPMILKIAISHKSKSAYISLNVKLLKSQWDQRAAKVKNHPDSNVINSQIFAERSRVESALINISADYRLDDLSCEEIKDKILRIIHPEDYVEECADNLVVNRWAIFIENKKESTKEVYQHTLSRIRAFRPDQYDSLKFEDITQDWLNVSVTAETDTFIS